MMTPVLETEKLYLRPIKATDINEIFDCWMQDEDISRYMYWKASTDINVTKDFVKSELLKITSDLWFRWIIILKKTGKIIGTCLIK